MVHFPLYSYSSGIISDKKLVDDKLHGWLGLQKLFIPLFLKENKQMPCSRRELVISKRKAQDSGIHGSLVHPDILPSLRQEEH